MKNIHWVLLPKLIVCGIMLVLMVIAAFISAGLCK
jgi:hypothetical protein